MNLQRLIEQYISFQRSLGSSFTGGAGTLRAFGRARGPRASVASVRVPHVEVFLGKARPVTRTWFDKLSCLQCFFRYAQSRGHITTMPLPIIMPKQPPAFVPYIYTREEIRRLFQVIESYRQGITLEPMTIRTMILTRVLHLFGTVFGQTGRASMPGIGYALEVSEDSEVPNTARRPADGSAYPVPGGFARPVGYRVP